MSCRAGRGQVCDLGAFHQEREVLLQMACDTFNNKDMLAEFAVWELLTSTEANKKVYATVILLDITKKQNKGKEMDMVLHMQWNIKTWVTCFASTLQ